MPLHNLTYHHLFPAVLLPVYTDSLHSADLYSRNISYIHLYRVPGQKKQPPYRILPFLPQTFAHFLYTLSTEPPVPLNLPHMHHSQNCSLLHLLILFRVL